MYHVYVIRVSEKKNKQGALENRPRSSGVDVIIGNFSFFFFFPCTSGDRRRF